MLRETRFGFGVWLERLTTVAIVLMAAASMSRGFWLPYNGSLQLGSFFQLHEVVDMLQRESDPIKRDAVSRSGAYRSINALIPPDARVFVLDILGPENFSKIGIFCYLNYYLFPRDVAISLDQPPVFQLGGVAGHEPASPEELKQAGYDFALPIKSDMTGYAIRLGSLVLRSPETNPQAIPQGDGIIALLLPLAVTITGSRIVRWLFRDLKGILTIGEWLACGLAVGAYFLTQLTLGLRLAGACWERVLTTIIAIWAVGEVALLVWNWRALRPQFKIRHLWWLLLVPAGLLLWCQFRLAGLLGLQEFDAVAFWAFKAKILHYCAGDEIWTWFRNPALAYAHLDYPLLVPLLHALTYGALGHVNEFVIKFWNQWMLLLLAAAVLGAMHFPKQRPWLSAAVATAIVLLPMTRKYALMEGATIPMLFYTVLSSMQLAVGMVEQQAGRLRLGLLLLLAAAMVKFEGMLLLGLWGVVLLLDRESRAALWPLRRLGWAGLLGVVAWLPYVVFRWNGPVPHPESGWVGLLIKNARAVLHILPMAWTAMLSRRFLNNDFAFWRSPDNQHAVWQGHWAGWSSLVDAWTPGVGWVCLLLLLVAWLRGGRLWWMGFRLCLMFLVFATVVSLVWSTVQPSSMNYTLALDGSVGAIGGRYLYPVLLAWLVAGVILLLRIRSNESAGLSQNEDAGHADLPADQGQPTNRLSS